MKTKAIVSVLMAVAFQVQAAHYVCHTFFDGTMPPMASGVVKWGGPTNFYGRIPAGHQGLGSTLTTLSTYESNTFTHVVGPVQVDYMASNCVLNFGFRGAAYEDTNACVVAGAGTAAAVGTYNWVAADNVYTNHGSTTYMLYEDTTPSWRILAANGTVLYTNVVGITGGTWVKSIAGGAPVPTSYWSGTNTAAAGVCTLTLVYSYTGSNGWTVWKNVSGTMDTTNWVQSITAASLTPNIYSPSAAYFAVYAGTNLCGAATTNAYLRMFVRE